MQQGLYIGLMSGTSVDAIDAVLTEFSSGGRRLIAHHCLPWPDGLRSEILALNHSGPDEIDRMGSLDRRCGEQFAQTALTLLKQADIEPEEIRAIGSHGQTIRHRPGLAHPFTLQIGDPNIIAERTGVTVVADFRRRDMAAGGEGAPLVPAFHAATLADHQECRVILNLGGIANITLLPGGDEPEVSGFDTGPANTLMDHWIRSTLQKPFDHDGEWAKRGRAHQPLLERLLADPYFDRAAPKSTGPEYFSPAWLATRLCGFESLSPETVQASLLQLTVRSIVTAIRQQAPDCRRVIACGGGTRNNWLMEEMARALSPTPLETTDRYGIDPGHVEAMAFAWLAARTLSGLSGNLPGVTGARHPVPLGAVYPAAHHS